MTTYKIQLFALGFILCIATQTHSESSTCLTVYKEGGAPAVFRSPKCPRWKLPNYDSDSEPRSRSRSTSGSSAARCYSALLQGRRKSQEDRCFCALDVRIPFPGPAGINEVKVDIVAVFDGHNGAEASEMASALLLEYFTLHIYFLLDATFSVLSRRSLGKLPNKEENSYVFRRLSLHEQINHHVLDLGRFKLAFSEIIDGSFHLQVMKEALLRAINDIDIKFSKEASSNNLDSGSTATIILMADGQILVANVGDSKAFLCSEILQSPSEAKATLLRLYRQRRQDGVISPLIDYKNFKLAASDGWAYFLAKELTRDHRPDREDERSRVESAGGYVSEYGGVSRVNGRLAVSRAIGDLSFKSYGVISIPEVTDWQPLTANDSYLVAASDGIFEKLGPQDVCDLLWEVHNYGSAGSESASLCMDSLVDCIINTAYEKGSMDNMAAVVVPFRPTGFPEQLIKESGDGGEELDYSTLRFQKYVHGYSGDCDTSKIMELGLARAAIAKFDRLLVEGKHSNFGCFYLSENLNDHGDHAFWLQKDDPEDKCDLPPALPDVLDYSHGGSLNLYNDLSMCLHSGMNMDGDKDQCINSEGFARFLSLLESIPLQITGTDHGSSEHAMPESRYILKRRFGRGSYGEVWLAFHWNCSEGSEASNWSPKSKKHASGAIHPGTTSRIHDYNAGPADDNMFILKRILVERGTSVYFSGLREKYFGEVFTNASKFLGGPLSTGNTASFWKESPFDLHELLEWEESVPQQFGNASSYKNMFSRENKSDGASYEEGLNHIARYIESFESQSKEIWLVFRHEGVSLSKLLYTAEEVANTIDEEMDKHTERIRILHPSNWWHWLKTTEAGQEEMRNLIWQLLMALKSCHDRNITHRDIKPENMVICFEDQKSGGCLKESPGRDKNYTLKMRIIDFGSAMDEFTVNHLYGSAGPSRAEQTYEYAPPEGLLNASWYKGPTSTTMKYDMWSVGVVILELILGSPEVFQINAITRALLDQHLAGWNDDLRELAYRLRSLMEMCILIPGSSSKFQHASDGSDNVAASPVSWKCSEEFFSHQIKMRDPLKIGFPNVWALRLVRQLLIWDPEDRLNVDDALRHPYFSQPSNRKAHGRI